MTTAFVLTLATLGTVAFPSLVRWRVESAAARRNLEVTVGAVHAGWFAIELRDVNASTAAAAPASVHANLSTVRVAFDVLGRVSFARVLGGAVVARGSGEELRELLSGRSGSAGGPSSSIPIEADAISVAWRASGDGADSTVLLRGVSLRRGSERTDITVESGEMSFARGSITIEAAAAALVHGELTELHAARADVTAIAASHDDTPPTLATLGAANAAALAPPPLPALSPARRRGVASRAPMPPTNDAALPVFRVPDLHALRTKVASVGAIAAVRIPLSAKITIDELTLKAGSGSHVFALGPGRLAAERDANEARVTFATKAEGAAAPVVFRAHVPLGEGAVTASFDGGPVSLALLENAGALGRATAPTILAGKSATLSGAASATLESTGKNLALDANVRLRGFVLDHPALASSPVRDLDVAVFVSATLDDEGALTIRRGELALDALRVIVAGTLEQRADHAAAAVTFEVPTASCQAMLDSVPAALFPTVRSARLRGTLGATGRVAFDSRSLDDLVLQYSFEDRCGFTDVPRGLAKERFAASFVHSVYEPDGTLGERMTGPGTSSWTEIDSISPYMEIAVLTTEDGAFPRHHGFNHGAIRGALIANLKAHKFVRGASTISMQLAKNVFLGREKTLSRKLEELVLTDYLEQVFEKREILELYLNVIEFGPAIYGITEAADHYFGRSPSELNLAECLFLASLLPAPLRYHYMFERGEVPAGWAKHVHQLMAISARVGLITKGELAEGLDEPIVFQKSGNARPVPRPPAAPERRHHDPESDWQEVDDP